MKDTTRRTFVKQGLLGSVAIATGCSAGELLESNDPILHSDCDVLEVNCVPTPSDIEGPFWLEGAPARSDLRENEEGDVLLELRGVVSDVGCEPLVGATVEIWHANNRGAYDNRASTMGYRGKVETDEAGAYLFRTILPGRYLNGGQLRPTHIHLKVHVGGAERLVTQIYFADDPYSEADSWADPARTACLVSEGEGFAAQFDVVLA